MSLALLMAGICAVVAGLLAVAFGYSIRDFSLGSTLIISGTIGVCSGMLLVGLYIVLLELQAIARRLAGTAAASEVRVRPVLPPGLAAPNALSAAAPEPAPAMRAEPPPSPAAPPWQAEAPARERPRAEAAAEPEPPPPPPAAPEAPRRRNLMFASSSRKERERAGAKAAEGPSQQAHAEPAEPEAPPASFDDAWPKADRARPPEPAAARRPSPRPASTFELAPQPAVPPPAPEPPPADQPPVTVLKSGIVDGMAYSLYSDGSIEAQMPEGMMRFASIDELRAHLDQRG